MKTNPYADAGSAGDAGGNSTVVIDPPAAAKGSDKNGAGQADICGVYRCDGVGGMGGTGGKLCPVGMPSLPGSACIPLRGCRRQRVRSRFRGAREVQTEAELFQANAMRSLFVVDMTMLVWRPGKVDAQARQ